MEVYAGSDKYRCEGENGVKCVLYPHELHCLWGVFHCCLKQLSSVQSLSFFSDRGLLKRKKSAEPLFIFPEKIKNPDSH